MPVPFVQPSPATDGEISDPSPGKTAYRCPHCHAYAQMATYLHVLLFTTEDASVRLGFDNDTHADWRAEMCTHCMCPVIWRETTMAWPTQTSAPIPHADLPADVRAIYDEARSIADKSARSAAALLRLATEMLVNQLVDSSGTLNDKIGVLAQRGLAVQVVRMLDVLRVVGNTGVHPGEIDLAGDRKTTAALFQLINLVVEQTITQPRLISSLHNALPDGARASIERRDGANGQI